MKSPLITIAIGAMTLVDFAYAGRKDSVALPYSMLSLGYYHKSGLFAQGFLSYLTSSDEQRVDMTGLIAGRCFL